MAKNKNTEKKKNGGIVCRGVILEALPNAFFKVKLENDFVVLAHISGKMRKGFIKVLPDDEVDVEVCPYDLTRGRILYRHK